MRRLLFTTIILLLALMLAACGGTETAVSPAEPAVQESSSDEAMADESMDDEMMEDESMDDEMMDDDMADDDMHDDMADESMDDEMMDDESMDDEMMDDESMDDEMMDDESMDDEMMDDESMDDEMMDDDMMATPAWQQIALTDAATGETFTFADFAGQTVFVEPMATWCSNCRRQLGNVRDAQAQLGDDSVVFVALSVENAISDADLAAYAAEQGFNWTFAVATPELMQALVDEYGRSVINPPATPHFIIRPDGTTTELTTGIEPADALIAQIQAASQ